jgi:hypothetical protein
MSLATVGAATPTLKANGSSAPGTIFVSGSYWALGAPVDLYMDPVGAEPYSSDVAHHVAIVWPSGSKGNFSTSFVVGPTELGEHKIIAVQGANPPVTLFTNGWVTATASFWIKSTQPLDDWAAQVLEVIQNDPDIGLTEIKTEVSNIEDHVAMFDSAYQCMYWTSAGTPSIQTMYDGIRHVSLTIRVDELSGLLNRDSVKVEIYFASPPTALPATPSGVWCELDTIYLNGLKVYEFDSDGWRITGNVKHPNVRCCYNVTTIGHNEPVADGPVCVQSYEPGPEYADQ